MLRGERNMCERCGIGSRENREIEFLERLIERTETRGGRQEEPFLRKARETLAILDKEREKSSRIHDSVAKPR